jgi:hypothetical protein
MICLGLDVQSYHSQNWLHLLSIVVNSLLGYRIAPNRNKTQHADSYKKASE